VNPSKIGDESMIYYHATNHKNLKSILAEGIKPSADGLVYLTDNMDNALKFMVLRPYEKIVVIEIKTEELDEAKIKESFDHSQTFFKCRAWGYQGIIPPIAISEFFEFERR
jgi:RNA:NAD 2'-phosphotransferase (TPT1/KptA family)